MSSADQPAIKTEVKKEQDEEGEQPGVAVPVPVPGADEPPPIGADELPLANDGSIDAASVLSEVILTNFRRAEKCCEHWTRRSLHHCDTFIFCIASMCSGRSNTG